MRLTAWIGRHHQTRQKTLLFCLKVAKPHTRFDVAKLVGRHLPGLINQRYMYLCTLNTVTIAVTLQILELDAATVVKLVTLARFVKVAKFWRHFFLQRLYMVAIKLWQAAPEDKRLQARVCLLYTSDAADE